MVQVEELRGFSNSRSASRAILFSSDFSLECWQCRTGKAHTVAALWEMRIDDHPKAIAELISRPGVFSLRVAGVAQNLLLVQCDLHTLLIGVCGLLTLDVLLML